VVKGERTRNEINVTQLPPSTFAVGVEAPNRSPRSQLPDLSHLLERDEDISRGRDPHRDTQPRPFLCVGSAGGLFHHAELLGLGLVEFSSRAQLSSTQIGGGGGLAHSLLNKRVGRWYCRCVSFRCGCFGRSAVRWSPLASLPKPVSRQPTLCSPKTIYRAD
jgi:hypothetical protein